SASMMTVLALGPPVSTLNASDRTLAALQLGRRAGLESRKYVVNSLMHARPQKAVSSHQADDALPWAIQRLQLFDKYCDDEATKEARASDVEKLKGFYEKFKAGSNSSSLEVDPQSPAGQVAHLYYQLAEATEDGKVVAKVPEWARKMIRKRVTVDSVEIVAFELMCLCMLEKPSEGGSGSEDSDSDTEEGSTLPRAIEERVWFLLERKCGQLSTRQGQLWERVHLASLAACAMALFVKCFLPGSGGGSEVSAREAISTVIAKPPPERVLLYGGRAVVAEDEMVEVGRISQGVVVKEAVRRRTLEEPYDRLLLLEDLERALHGGHPPVDAPPDQLRVAAAKAAAAASAQNLVGWSGVVDDGEEEEKERPSPTNLSIESEGKYCDFILVHGASALVSEDIIREVLPELPPGQEATLRYFLRGSGVLGDEPIDDSVLQSLVDDAESEGSVEEMGKIGQDFKMSLSDSYSMCGVCGVDCEGSFFICERCGISLHDACRSLIGWDNTNTTEGLCLACSHAQEGSQPRCSLCPCDVARRSVLMPMGDLGYADWCHLLCGLSFDGVSMVKDSEGFLRVLLASAARQGVPRRHQHQCSGCGEPIDRGHAQVKCSMRSCRRRYHAVCAPRRVDRLLRGSQGGPRRRKKEVQPLLYSVVSCCEHAALEQG
ncbi:hypothetical protein FOZ63_018797, partial [Perkinsus olseni]